MFGRLFKNKNKQYPIKTISKSLYEAAVLNSREAMFYEHMGVPDTFDGRFDLLLVHIFIINHILSGHEDSPEISQVLFDSMFVNMDQTLRERGGGDVGVPKHIKRMMTAYNGRMRAYEDAVSKCDLSLEEALKHNLYGTVDIVDLSKMKDYVMSNLDDKSSQRIEKILQGHIVFINQVD